MPKMKTYMGLDCEGWYLILLIIVGALATTIWIIVMARVLEVNHEDLQRRCLSGFDRHDYTVVGRPVAGDFSWSVNITDGQRLEVLRYDRYGGCVFEGESLSNH